MPNEESVGATRLTDSHRDYLDAQLQPGERVLWTGTTDVAGRRKRLVPVTVSCLFMLLLCSWVVSMNNPSPWAAIAVSAAVWVGLPVFIVWRQVDDLKRTVYAVTDRRALILCVGRPKRDKSYPAEEISFVRVASLRGGRGDVLFVALRGRARSGHPRRITVQHGFLAIEEPRHVAELMRATYGVTATEP